MTDTKPPLEPPFTLGQVEAGPPCCEPVAQLQIRDLAVAYGASQVLSGVSLDVFRGCITALIGPSGCGKSSFLACLNRLIDLLPGATASGTVQFDGQNILSPEQDVKRLRQRIGMIFQKPNPFPLSIRRNLELPLLERGINNKKEVNQRIETALRDVGLWEEVKTRLHSPATRLSGGQQQRLCIARALILEPEILLMDEPCSALDPISSAVVEELILRLKGRFTVIIVTHNLAQARRIANYAAFFWVTEKSGKLIEFNRCQHLFNNPRHALTEAYIAGIKG
ncbi:MAG: phosphate ABC transporter ATP-binding protein [Gammaproteobacteria bacterium HGW-Gammaproteobacteria-11]|nr:MAG: phosphate ABC transporter ATP-binding protein [Gammaproteobacteria bacterium HGW-Gammaproteobacteria-11]